MGGAGSDETPVGGAGSDETPVGGAGPDETPVGGSEADGVTVGETPTGGSEAGCGAVGETPVGGAAADEPGGARSSMSVSQLAERSGVGVPSIHHYRRLGLLPPPVPVAANRFLYDERHVEALRVIRLLRERRGLSLSAIREVLPDVLVNGEQPAFHPDMWDAVLAMSEVGDDEQREVRARLLEVARAAFVAKGYAGVNVEQLCQRAGIAKGSFYRHFDSKDSVYAAAARSTVDMVGASVARWRRAMPIADAVDAVAAAVEPVLPLLLEVVVRCAHGDGTVAGIVPEVVAGIGRLVALRLDVSSGPASMPGARAKEAAEASSGTGAGAHAPEPAAAAAFGTLAGAAAERSEEAAEGLGRAVAEAALDRLVRRALGLPGVPEVPSGRLSESAVSAAET